MYGEYDIVVTVGPRVPAEISDKFSVAFLESLCSAVERVYLPARESGSTVGAKLVIENPRYVKVTSKVPDIVITCTMPEHENVRTFSGHIEAALEKQLFIFTQKQDISDYSFCTQSLFR